MKTPLERIKEREYKEKLYEQVAMELSKGEQRTGLWAQAVANSDGNTQKAEALYIKYRVKALEDEYLLDISMAKERAQQNDIRAKDLQLSKKLEEEKKAKKIANYATMFVAFVALVFMVFMSR